jgi:hypothetical protein
LRVLLRGGILKEFRLPFPSLWAFADRVENRSDFRYTKKAPLVSRGGCNAGREATEAGLSILKEFRRFFVEEFGTNF